jgi:uncharacterized protein YycO
MIKNLVRLIGHIQFPFIDCKITAADYAWLAHNLRDGDIVLTRANGYLTNWFIKGRYTHATIFIKGLIYEAVGSGVRRIPLFDLVKDKDYLLVVRFKESFDTQKLYKDANSILGAKYDFLFLESDKYYCSEFVDYLYRLQCVGYNSKKVKSFGREIVLPVGFADHEQFVTVYKSEVNPYET